MGTEIRNVLMGRSKKEEAARREKSRLAKAGIYSSAGADLNATPLAPITVPATVGVHGWSRAVTSKNYDGRLSGSKATRAAPRDGT